MDHAQAAHILASLAGLPPPPSERPFRPFLRKLRLDPEAPLLRAKKIRPDTARAFEVGAWHGRGMLAGCVAFRLRDPLGRPVGYAGRRTDTDQVHRRGKWVFPPRLPKGELLYGFFQAGSWLDRGLVVVECAWSVLRLAQLDVRAVALLGTHLSPTQRNLLLRASRIVVMMDGDPAGRRAADRLRRQLPGATAIVDLPDGCDPDDLPDAHLVQLLHPHLPS